MSTIDIVEKMKKATVPSIEPLFDNVLLEPVEVERKAPGDLDLPDSAKDKDKPLVGIVRAIPTKPWLDKDKVIEPRLLVKVGQKVLYRKWSMSEIQEEGTNYVLVAHKDITAILH